MASLHRVSTAELRILAFAVSMRNSIRFDPNDARSRAKWKFRVRVRLSNFISEGRIPEDIAWRLRRLVPEECLRRVGVWDLVFGATNIQLPAPTLFRDISQNRENRSAGIVPSVMIPVPVPDPSSQDDVLQHAIQSPTGLMDDMELRNLPAVEKRRYFDLSKKVEKVRQDAERYLADWATQHNTSRSAFTDLLGRLNTLFPTLKLPKSAATILSVSLKFFQHL